MATKKSFKDSLNPAMQFISIPPEEQQPTQMSVPDGYRLNPQYIETKSKRVQLLMQPSLHSKLKAMAEAESTSINELIHNILLEATKGD